MSFTMSTENIVFLGGFIFSMRKRERQREREREKKKERKKNNLYPLLNLPRHRILLINMLIFIIQNCYSAVFMFWFCSMFPLWVWDSFALVWWMHMHFENSEDPSITTSPCSRETSSEKSAQLVGIKYATIVASSLTVL